MNRCTWPSLWHATKHLCTVNLPLMVSCATLGLAGRVVYPQCSGADARSIYKVRGILSDGRVQALHDEFAANGLISLNEIGVDPGLDHMSAVKIIDEVQSNIHMCIYMRMHAYIRISIGVSAYMYV
jgi:hypothetical protein